MSTPASLAEREFAIKAKDKAAVSEPSAFNKYAGGRQEAWCAHFASWIFAQLGNPLPGYRVPSPSVANPTAGCSYLYEQAKKMGVLRSYPQRDDIIFYKSSNPDKISGHVGIVTDVRDGKVVSIEGNLSDTVARVTHSLSDNKILGYANFYRAGLPLVGLVALGGSFWLTLKYLNRK